MKNETQITLAKNGLNIATDPTQFWSYDTVATKLDISRRAVERMVETGTLKPVRINRRLCRIPALQLVNLAMSVL